MVHHSRGPSLGWQFPESTQEETYFELLCLAHTSKFGMAIPRVHSGGNILRIAVSSPYWGQRCRTSPPPGYQAPVGTYDK